MVPVSDQCSGLSCIGIPEADWLHGIQACSRDSAAGSIGLSNPVVLFASAADPGVDFNGNLLGALLQLQLMISFFFNHLSAGILLTPGSWGFQFKCWPVAIRFRFR